MFFRTTFKVDGELTVSPKMSSLAVDDMQEQMLSLEQGSNLEPALYVITPRHLSGIQMLSSVSQLDDVVSIGGKFTVSF